MAEVPLGGDLWRITHDHDSEASRAPQAQPVYLALNLWQHPSIQRQPRPQDGKASKVNRRLSSNNISPKNRCCACLGTVFLFPLILCTCGLVLLPSAVYFIPRDLLLNNSSSVVQGMTSTVPTLSNISDNIKLNCSQGFFHLTNSVCQPSCEDYELGPDVNGFSLYRIVIIAAAALSCVATGCFLVLVLTVWRKTM